MEQQVPSEAVRPRVSVVVATYNRLALVSRLVRQLDEQSLDPSAYEVVVVDDGSAEPVRPALEALPVRYALRVVTQRNGGPAAARHAGVLAARAEVVVIVDDDMQVGRDFLRDHLEAHAPGTRRAVLGEIRPPPDLASMPLFERWHQGLLERFATDAVARPSELRGNQVYTGNLSFRREDYLGVGGFDPTLARSEDAELGLRLEKAGVGLVFSAKAYTVNGSDHTALATWRRRGEAYGVYDCRIGRKHGDVRHASPWRYWPQLSALSKPLLLGTALVPPISKALAGAAYAAAAASDRLGLERIAMAGTTLTFGMDYYRGVALELGSSAALLADLRSYLRGRPSGGRGERGAARRFVAAVRADHGMLRHYESRYGHHDASSGRLARDAVQKVGLQILVAVRGMRFLHDSGAALGAKIASRSIRHLYGSDIHWEAELEPGLVLVHGFGLAISRAAHVSKGCILFQNVTLGMGIDPATRRTGAPRLEANVHVGPGATLLGPITIGEGSKIQAGAVVTWSVPPHSVVMAPQPSVAARAEGQPPADVRLGRAAAVERR